MALELRGMACVCFLPDCPQCAELWRALPTMPSEPYDMNFYNHWRMVVEDDAARENRTWDMVRWASRSLPVEALERILDFLTIPPLSDELAALIYRDTD